MTPADARPPALRVWPLLRVRDIERSIDFWSDGLGFTLVGADGPEGARRWCRLGRDGASVMLQQHERREEAPTDTSRAQEPEATALYFVCDDVDRVHDELRGRGLELGEPSVAGYGMKQLRVPA